MAEARKQKHQGKQVLETTDPSDKCQQSNILSICEVNIWNNHTDKYVFNEMELHLKQSDCGNYANNKQI